MHATCDNGNRYDGESDISSLIEISEDPPKNITPAMLVAWNNPLQMFCPKVKIPTGLADIDKYNICHTTTKRLEK